MLRPGARDPIGASLPRQAALRLLHGRGQYVDDMQLPRMVQVAFLRSPHAHARIVRIATEGALAMPGVVRVLTGAEAAHHVRPYRGVLTHLAGMRSAEQWPLAVGRVRWQGEPVAAVVAATRACAEDALAALEIEYQELPAVASAEAALAAGAPRLHEEFDSNLCFEARVAAGDVEAALAAAAHRVELQLATTRVAPVPLEPRGLVAEFDPSVGTLTVHASAQSPHMLQILYARHLGLPESRVRVIVRDVGGGFGTKIHVYGDELATALLAMLLGRPVKFIADRLESFVSDKHARGHALTVRMGVDAGGRIAALEVDDLIGIGPYSAYPRGSVNEARHVLNLTGGCYAIANYRARARVAFTNRNLYAQYRGVGHPVACLAGEIALETAARAAGIDPIEFRRRNYIPEDRWPYRIASGTVYERLSQQACLDRLVAMMDYPALRREQAELRARGVYRGIGLASFVENSNHGATTYGKGGVPIASQDACAIALSAGGTVTCAAGVTDIGQGASTALAQIAAAAIGARLEDVRMVIGDTLVTPYGGGNWGSRGTGIAGEAVWIAGCALRENILRAASALAGCEPSMLAIRDGTIVDAMGGAVRMTLAELAATVYFRTDRFPAGVIPELSVVRSYAQKHYDGIYTNGIQASWLEIDPETGFVRLLRHWIVDDCGTVVNPLLVDGQLRGGIVQGIGQALFEGLEYDGNGQLVNGTLSDYLVPLAGGMPDLEVGHVSTPTATSELGAKGAGEAGVTGAVGAVWNAVNDALAPLGASIAAIPITPQRILEALGTVPPRR